MIKTQDPNASTKINTLENRSFGLIFMAIFMLIALFPLIGGGAVRLWALLVGGALLLISLIFPKILTPLNKLWSRFGQLMHKVTNPLLMGLVFFLTVLPTGMVLRLLRKDPMQRKKDPIIETYWISRENSVIRPESFDQQF